MKKGKSVKINLSDNFKSLYGTVDSKNLKSIYINIQSWVTPKMDLENWNRVVCNLNRELKHTVYNSINESIFEKNSIVDLDLRTSGINYGKKSFFNLDINLFLEKELEFKSPELKNNVKKIIKNVYNQNMSNNEYFDFAITKKENMIITD
jgi:hypothetical protein